MYTRPSNELAKLKTNWPNFVTRKCFCFSEIAPQQVLIASTLLLSYWTTGKYTFITWRYSVSRNRGTYTSSPQFGVVEDV